MLTSAPAPSHSHPDPTVSSVRGLLISNPAWERGWGSHQKRWTTSTPGLECLTLGTFELTFPSVFKAIQCSTENVYVAVMAKPQILTSSITAKPQGEHSFRLVTTLAAV